MNKNKSLLLYVFGLLVMMAFKSIYDNQSTLFDVIKLVAVKSPKQVEITLTSSSFDEMEEVILQRSTEANGFYRQIKILYKEDLQKANNQTLVVYDLYPLSVKSAGYYRVKIKLTTGVSRVYPGVQEVSYDNFNAVRNQIKPAQNTSAKKQEPRENVEEVMELQTEEQDAAPAVRSELVAKQFEEAMKATKFSIQKQSEFERKISIELPATEKLENIYVMMNNLKDQSYYTIKEFDRDQILNNNLKGKLEYPFKLEASAKPGSVYSIKLRLTSDIYHYETESQQFN